PTGDGRRPSRAADTGNDVQFQPTEAGAGARRLQGTAVERSPSHAPALGWGPDGRTGPLGGVDPAECNADGDCADTGRLIVQLGMVGLGRMGGNMTTRLLRDGHEVVAWARDPASVGRAAEEGAVPAKNLEDLVAKLSPPRH